MHSHLLYSTGGTRFIFEVASRLSHAYEVTVVVENISPEWEQKFREKEITVKELGGLTSTSQIYWLFFPIILLVNYIKIRRYTENKDVKLLSFLFPMNVLAAILKKPHVHYCFEPFAFFYDTSLRSSFSKLNQLLLSILSTLLSPLDHWAVNSADRLLAINPSVGRYIQEIYKRVPDAYSYLGVDTNHFRPIPTKNGNSFLTIFHSTDYTPLKGTSFLIKALALLKQKESSKLRVYVSESLENSAIKSQYLKILNDHKQKNIVRFLSHVPYKDLPKLYSESDVYFFLGDPTSSGATAASLSVLEAQACGIPVVRSIGNDDEVIPGKTGILVDPRDAKALAKLLSELIATPTIVRSMRKNTRKHITDKYTWEKVSKRIENEIALL